MVCSRCGIENAQLAETCRNCGADLNSNGKAISENPAGTPATQATKEGAIGWYLTAIKKYAVFTGRARRKEFWYFFLFQNLILIALMILGGLFRSANGLSPFNLLAAIYAIATIVPALAVSARRLHDINVSGWFCLLVFVPLVGGIILLVLCTQDSKPGENQYGPGPKAEPDPSVQISAPVANPVPVEPSTAATAYVPPPEASSTGTPDHVDSHESISPLQTEEPKPAPMAFCTQCGAEGVKDAKFCHRCGCALFRSGMEEGSAASSMLQAGRPDYPEQPTKAPGQGSKASIKDKQGSPPTQSGAADGTTAMPSGETDSNRTATNRSKWVVPALVALVATAGLVVALIMFRSVARYKYLKEGRVQYRVDRYRGRTDMLYGTEGWIPVSFDRPARKLTDFPDLVFGLNLTGGEWSRYSNQICFDAVNKTGYVLKQVTITVSITPPPKDDYPERNIVVLRPEYGGLLDQGKHARLCGTPELSLPSDAQWNDTVDTAEGWKDN